MTDTRKAILQILAKSKPFWNGNFPQKFVHLSQKDKNFITEIVKGIQRHKCTLEYIISKYSRTAPQPKINNCLQMGLYQMLYLSKIPDYATIHETVEMAKKISPKATKYVNALLRTVQRAAKQKKGSHSSAYLPITHEDGWEFQTEIFPCPKKNIDAYLSVAYSFPEILIKKWRQNFGIEKCQQLLVCGNTRPPITIRLRQNIDGPWKFIEDQVAIVEKKGNISSLPGYDTGAWVVQGITSIEVVKMIEIESGNKVLDMCAAPGGKSFHLADQMQDEGLVFACDKSQRRLKTLNANKKRLRSNNVYPLAIDTKSLPKKWKQKFDCVLIDAPCTNSGVFNKRAEARWRFSHKNLQQLCNEQKEFLSSGAEAVAINGKLVYSTCSIEVEENEVLIEEFLQQNTSFKLLRKKIMMPSLPLVDGGSVHVLQRIK